MTKTTFLLTGLLAMTFWNEASADAPNGVQRPQTLDRQVRVQMDYLLYLPRDYDQRDQWPLLLFLHGVGERAPDINKVKTHGPPKLIAAGKPLPLIVVSPQCPADQWWRPAELAALLDEVVGKYKVDEDRVYVTGLSMGGFGTWALAAYSPDRFAAIAPVCGGGEPLLTAWFHFPPAWVFHGAKDSVVPIARARAMVEALQKAGSEVKLTVYPDAGHDSWTETYKNPDLYAWLLQHTRGSAKR